MTCVKIVEPTGAGCPVGSTILFYAAGNWLIEKKKIEDKEKIL